MEPSVILTFEESRARMIEALDAARRGDDQAAAVAFLSAYPFLYGKVEQIERLSSEKYAVLWSGYRSSLEIGRRIVTRAGRVPALKEFIPFVESCIAILDERFNDVAGFN